MLTQLFATNVGVSSKSALDEQIATIRFNTASAITITETVAFPMHNDQADQEDPETATFGLIPFTEGADNPFVVPSPGPAGPSPQQSPVPSPGPYAGPTLGSGLCPGANQPSVFSPSCSTSRAPANQTSSTAVSSSPPPAPTPDPQPPGVSADADSVREDPPSPYQEEVIRGLQFTPMSKHSMMHNLSQLCSRGERERPISFKHLAAIEGNQSSVFSPSCSTSPAPANQTSSTAVSSSPPPAPTPPPDPQPPGVSADADSVREDPPSPYQEEVIRGLQFTDYTCPS
ncbi:mucin-1-like [Neocloeon triangulifer]|uniref:mucin-1-like n=1 Tax=Neocloeon triangulifer TaxID=2078957 RepID=UPI00286F13C4|nr:mucin-1-like [Neocloeon triangulifer]